MKKQKVSKTWIEDQTGKTDIYWFRRIGSLIGKHSYPVKGSVHDNTDLVIWMVDLITEILSCVKEDRKRDGNMRMASILSYLLMKWFIRILRAKSYDPRRRLKDRRRMMRYVANYCGMVIDALMDESQDHKFFPEQKWDSPFAPGAKNGKYQ